MELFDSYASYGMRANEGRDGAETFAEMKAALSDAGIRQAMVFRREATVSGAVMANPLLAADLSDQRDLSSQRDRRDLPGHQPKAAPTRSADEFVGTGIWSILPSGSPEFPDPQALPAQMLENRVSALRLAPRVDRFAEALWAVDDYLAMAEERGIPVYVDTQEGISGALLGDILGLFPRLPVVFCWHTVWSGDRWFRALRRRFDNAYIQLGQVHTEGFFEDFTSRFGHERLLFASGYPRFYPGGTVLNLLKSDISSEAMESIAHRNMEKLLEGVKLG